VNIVGTDEVDLDRNHVSWMSPLGRALMQSAEGDSVVLKAPGGKERLTVLEVRYERIAVDPSVNPHFLLQNIQHRGLWVDLGCTVFGVGTFTGVVAAEEQEGCNRRSRGGWSSRSEAVAGWTAWLPRYFPG
jgi:hypothetical protein